jgi:hypothetical protein
MPRSVPVALTANSPFHAVSVSSISGETWMMPALLTSRDQSTIGRYGDIAASWNRDAVVGHTGRRGARV